MNNKSSTPVAGKAFGQATQTQPVLDQHELDQYIGQRLERRRRLMNMTQAQVGAGIGIGRQQVGRYEGGTTIPASRLYQISRVLDAPVTYFYPAAPKP